MLIHFYLLRRTQGGAEETIDYMVANLHRFLKFKSKNSWRWFRENFIAFNLKFCAFWKIRKYVGTPNTGENVNIARRVFANIFVAVLRNLEYVFILTGSYMSGWELRTYHAYGNYFHV